MTSTKYYRQLLELLYPPLHSLSSGFNLQTTILIHGPRGYLFHLCTHCLPGCGKSSIVHSATKKLGIHIVDVNCWDILGSFESQTDSNIRDLFQRASENVPCLLLLRHVHALEKTAQQLQPMKGFHFQRIL